MPRGILNRNIYVNGVWLTSEEVRNSLLDRNLPPPVTDAVIDGGVQSFQQQMGEIIFSLPSRIENIPLDKEKIKNDKIEDRDGLLNYNKYSALSGEYEYEVLSPPSLNVTGKFSGDYSNQNFGLVGLTNGFSIRNPFTVIDANRGDNFDTALGNIASNRLEYLINERVSQSIQNQTIDRVNTNLLNLSQGNEFIQSNYDITTPANIIGKGVELLGKITGVQLPVSTIPKGAIGWQEYNSPSGRFEKIKNSVNNLLSKIGVTAGVNLNTEQRTTELLKRTGPGQKNALFRHLRINTYVPDYSSPRLFGVLGDRAPSSRYYIGNESSTNRGGGITKIFTAEDFTEQSTDIDSEINGEQVVRPTKDFVWGGEETKFPDQTILAKTANLTKLHSETGVFIDQTKKFFKDKINGKDISRGSAIGEYDRVWLKSTDGTQLENGYSYQNAIRKSGLFNKNLTKPGFSVDSGKSSLSVLQNNGIVKSYPNSIDESFTTYKKYMLSLENLAWSDNLADLPIQEIGPGDLVNGRKGRIMWFAPYDLSFDETTTANWNTTEFLGRGEPVYTYNNTNRSGSFKFKILVDHPRIINEYRGRQNTDIEEFLAGIKTPQQFLDIIQRNTSLDQNTKKQLEKKANSIVRQTKADYTTKTTSFSIYFENGSYMSTNDTYNPDGLNKEFIDLSDSGNRINKILKDKNLTIKINFTGFVSKREINGIDINRSGFGEIRSETALFYTLKKVFGNGSEVPKNIKETINYNNNDNLLSASKTADIDSEAAIRDRRVDVTITYYPKGDDVDQSEEFQKNINEQLSNDLDIVSNLFINETTYFDMIADDYPNYFSNISSKIKYFQPGFHSTTPEGLNSRITFLQQCMRQGPSIYGDVGNVKPDNLAFGRPPVCILRIGDFINTKVIIQSLSINYEDNGFQWDLNPEGIGVQPMIANVQMTIELIGGQSLQGPINRLQNALSYNFYANTEMYDPRADSIRLNGEGGEIVDGVSLGEIRKAAGVDVTTQLKNELPIDQEATRLKAEANEKAAAAAATATTEPTLFITINEGNEDRAVKYEIKDTVNGMPETVETINDTVSDNTIIVISQTGATLETAVEERPGLLVDGSGDNRIKLSIRGTSPSGRSFELGLSNINTKTESFTLYETVNSIFKTILDEFDKEIMDEYRKITWKEVHGCDMCSSRDIKNLGRQKAKLEKERDEFIETNTIDLTVEANFTRKKSISNKKNNIYKLTKKTPQIYYWKKQ